MHCDLLILDKIREGRARKEREGREGGREGEREGKRGKEGQVISVKPRALKVASPVRPCLHKRHTNYPACI